MSAAAARAGKADASVDPEEASTKRRNVAGTFAAVEARFVDRHSHVVPSGDDGAKTLEDGLALCDLAADAGTAILFATPHVWPH